MRPDDDGSTARPVNSTDVSTSDGAGPQRSTPTLAGATETPAEPDWSDLDGGGDPPCWLGLVDDQRDHQ